MRILVTGGAGFIGSHLVERFVSLGHDVTVVDNFFRGSEKNLRRIRNDITLVKGDVQDRELMDRLIKENEVIYHIAGVSRVLQSVKNPELCFKYNIVGTYNVIKCCVRYGRKLIFTSSREVYGDADYLPVDENHPLKPKNPYAASKVACESMIMAYGNSFDLEYVILRLANVFGSRDFERVIPIFLEKCQKNETIVIFGGKQVLDFIYVSDAVDALIRSLNLHNEILNIGSGKGITILELAHLIKTLTNSTSKIVFAPKRKEEVNRFVADISKARKLLKWRPKVSLEVGIKKMLSEEEHIKIT